MTAKSYARNDPMRTDFDDDPEDERNDPPYHLYGLLFCIALALAGVTGWLVFLERSQPMFLPSMVTSSKN
jgi:hypothetical protein